MPKTTSSFTTWPQLGKLHRVVAGRLKRRPVYHLGYPQWPVTYGSLVYFTSQSGHIFAFDQTTGSIVWTGLLNKNGSPTTGIVAGGGIVYVGDRDMMYAFNATNGHLVWRRSFSPPEFSTAPALGDGVFYFANAFGVLHAVNAANGGLIWQVQPAGTGPYLYSPAIAYGYVYIGVNTSIYAYNAYTGVFAFKMATGVDHLVGSPAIANGVVYINTSPDASGDIGLYAYNAMTGAKLWTAPYGYRIDSSPTVTGGYLYVSANPVLYAFHA